MKQLSPSEMVDTVIASNDERHSLAEQMTGITPLLDLAQLERLTAEGFITAVLIRENKTPVYCVWLHSTIDGGCHINAAVQLVKKTPGFDVFAAGIIEYAKRNGCKFIRFNTKRAGLVAMAETIGFTVDSLTLIKKL